MENDDMGYKDGRCPLFMLIKAFGVWYLCISLEPLHNGTHLLMITIAPLILVRRPDDKKVYQK